MTPPLTRQSAVREAVACGGRSYPAPEEAIRHQGWSGLPGPRVRYARAMPTITRVLDPDPVPNFDAYVAAGGGKGLEAARKLGPSATVEEIDASGLRGRGGAGFPTGRKWAAVAANRGRGLRPSAVVNASEGEPGSFKDRALLRRNPYRIIEGAIIAAEAVDAERIVFALKASFRPELERLRLALDEVAKAGWTDVALGVVEGPAEDLYGEEAAPLAGG